jgi:hypothetical protein
MEKEEEEDSDRFTAHPGPAAPTRLMQELTDDKGQRPEGALLD